MNIIIRLQNLPWSANASDIRQFFKGLHIPEGGVHIVGGENGDAFIAFSTDEDARQAMSMTGGKLKEVQVSLLLSSRAEMQKVIEKARLMSMQSSVQKTTQALPSAEAFTNQFGRKLPDNTGIINAQQSQQQIALANYQQQQQLQPGLLSTSLLNLQMKPNELLSSLQANAVSAIPPNLVANQLPLYNYGQLNSAEYLNYVKMANAAGNFHLENSKMQQQNSYNIDHNRERQRSRSPISRYDIDDKKERRRRTRFSSPDNAKQSPPLTGNMLPQKPSLHIHQQQLQQQQQAVVSTNMLATSNAPKLPSNIWDVPPLNLNSYASFNGNSNASMLKNNLAPSNFAPSAAAPSHSYQANDNKSFLPSVQQYQSTSLTGGSSTSSGPGVGRCIKVANVDKETAYSDIRKFFNGLPIDDIKFLNDSKGNHTGVVLIKFISSDSKKQSMTKNGWQLKSTQIMITSITEDDYECGLDGKSRDAHRRNDDSRRGQRDRHRYRSHSHDREDSRDRDRFGRNRDQNGRNNGNRHNGGGGGGGNNNRFNNRRDNRRDNNIRRRDEEPEEKIEYVPDENFTVLIIDDIPDKNEQDLCEAFPNIVSITIDKYTAYVKFTTHDAAKAVLENRFLHYIRNKRVFVEIGSELQFTDYAKKFGKYDNPEFKDKAESETAQTISENSNESQEMRIDDNSSSSIITNSTNNNNNDDRPVQSASRDPRQQRSLQNGSDRSSVGSNSNSNMPKLRTDCILVKNLDPGCSIEDVENFFSEIQRSNMRTHILLDKKGQPCGDCFVEFKFEHDMHRALALNNTMMGPNKLQIMPIPREQVEAVLSSFGDDNGKSQHNGNRQSNRDWAPPADFGSPGCVVMLSNLCYRANADDIVAEFGEFNLHPDQVIRRYNDMGQPTGNACVNFNSPGDAEKACDAYNKVKILNRPVWLRRL